MHLGSLSSSSEGPTTTGSTSSLVGSVKDSGVGAVENGDGLDIGDRQ